MSGSKQWNAQADCVGKRTFESPSLASKIVRDMKRHRKSVKAYRCGWCGKWHISSAQKYLGPKRKIRQWQ